MHDVAHPELREELRLPPRDRHGRHVVEVAVVRDEVLDALVMKRDHGRHRAHRAERDGGGLVGVDHVERRVLGADGAPRERRVTELGQVVGRPHGRGEVRSELALRRRIAGREHGHVVAIALQGPGELRDDQLRPPVPPRRNRHGTRRQQGYPHGSAGPLRTDRAAWMRAPAGVRATMASRARCRCHARQSEGARAAVPTHGRLETKRDMGRVAVAPRAGSNDAGLRENGAPRAGARPMCGSHIKRAAGSRSACFPHASRSG